MTANAEPGVVDKQIEKRIEQVAHIFVETWAAFHLLEGLHEGATKHPSGLRDFERLFDEVWQCAFDSFFARVGTLLDRTRKTHSLPNLVTALKARKPPSQGVNESLNNLSARVQVDSGPIEKFRRWRNDSVAHRGSAIERPEFYTENKLDLSEIRSALIDLEAAFNEVCRATINVHHGMRAATFNIRVQGEMLLEALARDAALAPRLNPATEPQSLEQSVKIDMEGYQGISLHPHKSGGDET